MKRYFTHVGIVGLVLSVTLVSATTALGANGQGAKPLAGPWYTPTELNALIAYSNASLAQKRTLLNGAPPAGPSYTAAERNALIAYSNASFAEKQRILDGGAPTSVSASGSFDWGDAGVGAGAALGGMLTAGCLAIMLARARKRRAPYTTYT